MKKKILIILLIFISILIGCSESKGSVKPDPYSEQTDKVSTLLRNCEIDSDIILNYIRDIENIDSYRTYDLENADFDKHKRCMNNLDQLTCEEVSKITSLEKLKEIEDCFQFPLSTKKQACVHNQEDFCRKIYVNCGEDKLIDICGDSFKTWGSSESTEYDWDDDMLNNYCDSTIAKDQEITDQSDLFIYQCEDYSIDCDNVDMLDFRNSEWKNSCIE